MSKGLSDGMSSIKGRKRSGGVTKCSERQNKPSSLRFRFKHHNDIITTSSKDESFSVTRQKAGGGREYTRRKRKISLHDKYNSEQDNRDVDKFIAHPLPRPAASPSLESPYPILSADRLENDNLSAENAFKYSLFDALNGNEEAATYWEGVYSQPVNIYPRPSTINTDTEDQGKNMDDDKYAEYVMNKMWEKANPSLVRDIKLQKKQEAYQRSRDLPQQSPKVSVEEALARGKEYKARQKEKDYWQAIYTNYINQWTKIEDLLRSNLAAEATCPPCPNETRLKFRQIDIPWPIEPGNFSGLQQDSIRDQVLSFWRNVMNSCEPVGPSPDCDKAVDVGGEKINLSVGKNVGRNPETEASGWACWVPTLKLERFRWHPDKFFHRLGALQGSGNPIFDRGLRLEEVTAVFQAVDESLRLAYAF